MKKAKKIIDSEYQIVATGLRDLDANELVNILTVIIYSDPNKLDRKLQQIYDYEPNTIQMSKGWKEKNCENYNSYCDCFYPWVDFENCWCMENIYTEQYEKERIRNSKEYADWRNAVFERDDYICQKCGQRGGELNAHHIKLYADYPDLRLDLNNGITFCKECHIEEHKVGD